MGATPTRLTRIEKNPYGSHQACENPHQADDHPWAKGMVQDVVHGVKRDDFGAPQDKRKQDTGNREKSASPTAKDAQGSEQTNQEQHRQDCDGDELGRPSNRILVPALR